MTRLRFIPAALVMGSLTWSGAHAQVTLDVTKITCEQFTLFKITDPDNIALWLSGYYHGKRDNTVLDTQQFRANAQKIKTYCIFNQNDTVMHAVETTFAPAK
jgi:acid stress chaperone HdeB